MSEHFNIQINIQRVEEPKPVEVSSYQSRPANSLPPMTERKVIKVLDLAITADSEREAYAKAHRLLSASEPEWTTSVPVGTVVERGPGGQVTIRPE